MVKDLLKDTQVDGPSSPGCYSASLSPDWAVWGPNGGYLAALAMQAAYREARLPRPAVFQCHFLAVGEFAPVDIEVTRLGGGKRAESLRVDVRQGDRLLVAATVWMIDDGLQGFEHDVAVAPEVASHPELATYEEHAGDEYANWFPIWRSIEGKPLRWQEPPADPKWHCWLRFRETPIPDERSDALRQLFWLDMPAWNATISAHGWPFEYLTPNLDLMVHFHQFSPEQDWMLAEGYVPVAKEGMVGCVSRLWTEDGRLLATGTSTHSCRPNPSYEADLALAREQGLVPED